jgi:NADPH:quinone reductase-like Zn-dependent oxidoreductase
MVEADGGVMIGAYAEYISVSTHMLVHKPEELSWEECAGIPEVSVITSILPMRSSPRRHSQSSY